MAPIVAEIMADELSKDNQWIKDELADYTNLASGYILT
jgi:glycerol-3-phosphate dehydrogenase